MKVTGMVVDVSVVSFLCKEPACQSPITEEQTTQHLVTYNKSFSLVHNSWVQN